MADELRGIAKGWAKRTLATTRVAASFGRHAARKVVDKALDIDRERDEGTVHDEADAEALAEKLDQMKGLMMKLGQMASYLDGAMPERAQKRLQRLQSEAKALEWPVVEEVLQAQWGRPISEVASSFETTPFAAASIGQVHRAEIDGRKVAVKVQYPEIADAIEIDVGNLKKMAIVGGFGTAFDTAGLVDELHDRLRDECNYLQEAAYQRLFRNSWAREPRVWIPDVVTPLCRERVLVTELVEGRPFDRFVATASAEERNRAGLLLYEYAFRSIFVDGMFNGDPHPGNYLFPEDGRVAFLDYGCVRVFSFDLVTKWKRIARSVLAGDKAAFRAAFEDSGFVGSRRFDHDAQWEAIRYLYEPMLASDFTYTQAYVKRVWDVLVFDSPNKRKTKMPPEWLLVNRLQWGLNSVLAKMGARGDFSKIFREVVETPVRIVARPAPLDPAA
jgi:predicted unusual protein kinase regulating ubiquinone biosynthesis (AarF/ABC1/UbiB family)